MRTSIQVTCRHNAILARLLGCDYISTDDLSRELNVSVHTIRRDLNILEGQQRLRRCHGGAGGINQQGNKADGGVIEQRLTLAKAIVQQLAAGSCLYVDSPSIGEILVGLLPEEVYYLVTQRIELIGLALKNPFIGVFFLGGELSPGGADASIPMSMIKNIPRRVDCCIVEVDCIDNNGILFDEGFQHASVKRYFLQHSQRQYVICRKAANTGGLLVKLGSAGHHKRVFWLTQQAEPAIIGEG